MNKKPDELYEIVSLRPTELETLRPIRHVAYKHSKESCDEYVAWLNATQYNRGTVEEVTRYVRAEPTVEKALEIARHHGGIDGAHHKAWVIDQIVRALTGKNYDTWIAEHCDGEDGPDTYSWDEGTAP
jgi:hypothetical protein